MSIFRRLSCAVRGHDYRVHQRFTAHSRRVVCDRCGGDWGMNDDVRAFIPWSAELEDMYKLIGHAIVPRTARTENQEGV